MTNTDARSVARAYHDAWAHKDFPAAIALLSAQLEIEVPINHYPTRDSFAEALAGFGGLVTSVELLSELGDSREAMQLYDIDVDGLGTMRVAEHFTVSDGRIVRLRQIHDTAALRAIAADEEKSKQERDYVRVVRIRAPREAAFAAVTTLDGLAGWWTPLVAGDGNTGGELEFHFPGLEEQVVIRVDEATRDERVVWTCLEHSGHPEWAGTRVVFELEAAGPNRCVLRFRHEGLIPLLDCYLVCESGWERFLTSIAAYSETGSGKPFVGNAG